MKTKCVVPECGGISLSDPTFREGLWNRYSTAEFRLIGKDVMRVELPQKVNGTAQYSIDVQVPEMLYGVS